MLFGTLSLKVFLDGMRPQTSLHPDGKIVCLRVHCMAELYYNNVTRDRWNVTGFDVNILPVFVILGTVQGAS